MAHYIGIAPERLRKLGVMFSSMSNTTTLRLHKVVHLYTLHNEYACVNMHSFMQIYDLGSRETCPVASRHFP